MFLDNKRSEAYLCLRNLSQRKQHVELTSIWCQYVENKPSSFHIILTYFFDKISIGKKIDIFFQRNSMGEKKTSFRCAFFELLSIEKKLMFFRCILSMQLQWMKNWDNSDLLILMILKEKNRFPFDIFFDKFLTYQKLKLLRRLFFKYFCFDVVFQSNSASTWIS